MTVSLGHDRGPDRTRNSGQQRNSRLYTLFSDCEKVGLLRSTQDANWVPKVLREIQLV